MGMVFVASFAAETAAPPVTIHIDLETDELGGDIGITLATAFTPTTFYQYCLTFRPAEFKQTLGEGNRFFAPS